VVSVAVAVASAVVVVVAVAVPAGELVAGAEPGEPQEASVIARHTAEKAVSADDAGRRIRPSLRIKKDGGLRVPYATF